MDNALQEWFLTLLNFLPCTKYSNCHLDALLLTGTHTVTHKYVIYEMEDALEIWLSFLKNYLLWLHWWQPQHPKASSQISYLYDFRTEGCFEQEVELSLHQQRRNETKHSLFRTWNGDGAFCPLLFQCLQVSKHYCCVPNVFLKKMVFFKENQQPHNVYWFMKCL